MINKIVNTDLNKTSKNTRKAKITREDIANTYTDRFGFPMEAKDILRFKLITTDKFNYYFIKLIPPNDYGDTQKEIQLIIIRHGSMSMGEVYDAWEEGERMKNFSWKNDDILKRVEKLEKENDYDDDEKESVWDKMTQNYFDQDKYLLDV